MSRSPDDPEDPDQRADYQQANLQLGLLAEQGFSWSGNERNCAFLNTHGGPFANISAVTGFDFVDDGRSLAMVDWDHDGDLDVWVGNRTAPRVRFLRNDVSAANHFVALALEGKTCNRDAIGARVEVVAEGRPADVLIRTLRAGEGFLGQSSRWLHFGLGASERLARVTVRWPGGEAEDFEGVALDRFQRLVQGTGRARVWDPPVRDLALAPTPTSTERPRSQARIFLTSRLPLPSLSYETFAREARSNDLTSDAPLLVNLWASWCQPCIAELTHFGAQAQALDAAGVDVLALSVDGLGGDESSSVEAAARLMQRLDLPFESGLASPELVDTLQITHDLLLAQRRPLPVPTSFLLDAQGRVSVIYKGPVSVEQLLADVAVLGQSSEVQESATLPFPGRWLGSANRSARALPLLNQLAAAGYVEAAVGYVDEHLPLLALEPDLPGFLAKLELDLRRREPSARSSTALGRVLLAAGRYAEAAAAFRAALTDEASAASASHGLARALGHTEGYAEALQIFGALVQADPDDPSLYASRAELYSGLENQQLALEDAARVVERRPKSADAHFRLARASSALGQSGQALEECSATLALQSDHADALLLRGRLLAESGEFAAASADLERATRVAPDHALAHAEFAWLRATCPDAGWRDPRAALASAERAVELSRGGSPRALQALAAAHAESGDFASALEWQAKAIALATPVEQARYRLVRESFEAGRPFRDTF